MAVSSTDGRFERLKDFKGRTFHFAKYKAPSDDWNHDHCNGCWAKFAEYGGPDILHEGYVHAEPYEVGPEPEFITECKEQGMRCIPAPAVHGLELQWVCPRCFEDFREVLAFKLGPDEPDEGKR